jgi:hypothetical protein
MRFLQLGYLREVADGALEALHRIKHARQGRTNLRSLNHLGGQFLLQQVEQAFDIGDGALRSWLAV